VIAALDPRSWETCSDYFLASYAVEMVDGQPQSNDGVWIPDEARKGTPLGASWRGILFERFAYSFDGIEVYHFDNLISVEQTIERGKSGPRWSLSYSLFRSLLPQVGIFTRAGGIDVDGDGIEVTQTDYRARMVARKSIRFTDNTPRSTFPNGPLDFGLSANYIAPIVLSTWTEQSIAEQTCCHALHEGGNG
jgi:hypothetical protein